MKILMVLLVCFCLSCGSVQPTGYDYDLSNVDCENIDDRFKFFINGRVSECIIHGNNAEYCDKIMKLLYCPRTR